MIKRTTEEGNTHHIGYAIEQLLNQYQIKTKFNEVTLMTSWERLVGKPIAKRTKKLSVKDKVLFVELVSPSLKNDLSLHKQQIIAILEKEFGEKVISEIIFM